MVSFVKVDCKSTDSLVGIAKPTSGLNPDQRIVIIFMDEIQIQASGSRAGGNLKLLIESKNTPRAEAREMWRRLSSVYAKGTEGTAHFFPGQSISPTSIWLNTERPILMGNGVKIVTH